MDARLTVALVASLAFPTAPLLAHGGQYQGPSAGGPADASQPPTNPGGAATGTGPGGASAGAGAASGATGGAGGARGASGRGSGGSGSGAAASTAVERWEFWWEANRNDLLELKSRLGSRARVAGGIADLTGRGRKTDTLSARTSPEVVDAEIVPLLERLLASETDRDILDSCVLALARSTRPARAAEAAASIEAHLGHRELSVSTSATLALGVLGEASAAPLLRELMNDAPAGQKRHGGGPVPWLARAFAALSLGLLDDAESVDDLCRVAEESGPGERDLRICALVALSLMDSARSAQVGGRLQALLADTTLEPTVRAYVPSTLAKLGDRAAVGSLVGVLVAPATPGLVRQSAALALGRLAQPVDEAAVAALVGHVRGGGDALTRHFALVALGKIGARDEDPASHQAVHSELVELFTQQIEEPEHRAHRPWAALGAALYGRAQARGSAEIVEVVTRVYTREKDPSVRGACAIALGLLRAEEAAPALLLDLQRSTDEDFRGFAAIALGLLRHGEAAPALRELCRSSSLSPGFRLQVAIGLGLLADPGAVDALVETLRSARTLGESAAVARALGLIGNDAAVASLRELAEEDGAADLTRAFACVGLGLVGERTELPFNAGIGADLNYTAVVPSIAEVLDIL